MSWWSCVLGFLGLLGLLGLLGGPVAAQGGTPPPPPRVVDAARPEGSAGTAGGRASGAFLPRLEDARAQFALARAWKNRRVAEPEEERRRSTRRAVAAYRAVRELHPDAPALGAEAAFRAGELLAALGERAEALREFRVAETLGAGTPFRARARLASGHQHRRAGAWQRALDAYLAVCSDPDAAPAYRDEAWLFAGDARHARGGEGDRDEAVRCWRTVARGARDPRDRIAAYERIGRRQLEDGDLEAAAGVLDECLRALASDALEETERGERVRRALANMHLVRALPVAIERRRREQASQTSSRNP